MSRRCDGKTVSSASIPALKSEDGLPQVDGSRGNRNLKAAKRAEGVERVPPVSGGVTHRCRTYPVVLITGVDMDPLVHRPVECLKFFINKNRRSRSTRTLSCCVRCAYELIEGKSINLIPFRSYLHSFQYSGLASASIPNVGVCG